MAYIELSGKRGKGKRTLVDESTLKKYGHLSWYLSDTGYAMRTTSEGRLRLHRLVANTPEGMFTDHKNHDRLDNRASNLRVVTQKENMNNYKGQKGYTWDKSKGKYMVRYKNTFYGRYDTEDRAKKAYKLACSGVPYKKKYKPKRLYFLPVGVNKQNGSKKYNAKFVYKTKEYYLGSFNTVEEAEKALLQKKTEICQ